MQFCNDITTRNKGIKTNDLEILDLSEWIESMTVCTFVLAGTSTHIQYIYSKKKQQSKAFKCQLGEMCTRGTFRGLQATPT